TGVAHILSLVASSAKPLSAWVETLPQYFMVKRVYRNVTPDALTKAASSAARFIPNAEMDKRDGIHVSGNIDGRPLWVHLRSSNTEPVVRLIAEASSPEDLKRILDAVKL
ncbi:MAG TPA: hypothetical protein PLY93_14495, partial [Turneriella sp.]|nr:hypothetical protein [Turneriella sp.]